MRFENLFFPKEFLECIGYISTYFPIFSAYFVHENFPYKILWKFTKFQYQNFQSETLFNLSLGFRIYLQLTSSINSAMLD